MASRGSPYQGHSISGEGQEGGIQLSDRQMQLMEARKRSKEAGLQTTQFKGSNNSGAKRDPTPRMDNKATQGTSWSDEQTVPTTWSDSSSSANSSVSKVSSRAVSSVVSAAMSKASSGSRVNPANKFYSQGLDGQTKKLFDDSGASYHGSRSEASSIMSRSMMNKQSQQEPEVMPRRVNRVPQQEAPTQAASKPQEAVPLTTGDQQKAFLRKMMKSYTTKPSKGGKDKVDETASEVSSANESAKTGSWIDRKSKSASSASSGTSSASHDKAIMRKVLERARNKKMALSNPRKQGLLKQSSSKMKKLLSPKQDKSSPRMKKSASPSSHTSSDSGSQSSKRFGFGSMLSTKKKKASRSPRFSSRNAKTRVYNKPDSIFLADQAHTNDEATASKKSLERNFDTVESTASTASETISNTERSTKTGDVSKPVKKLYDDSGASVALSETASETFGTMTSKPEAIHIKRQATDVSALTRKHSHATADGVETAQSNSTIASIPEVTQDDEIEIKLSGSSLSQHDNRYSIPNSNTAKSAVFPSKHEQTMYDDTEYDAPPEMFNPEPEGYTEFLQTLKTEVSGTHSQLWESFHSLFRSNETTTQPLNYGKAGGAFDDKTKNAVASMSTYLKTKYGAESEAGTQLANDKAVKASSSFGQHILKRSSYGVFCTAPPVDDEPATLMISESESEVSSYAATSYAGTSYAGTSYAGTSYVESEYLSEAGSFASSHASRFSAGSKFSRVSTDSKASVHPKAASSAKEGSTPIVQATKRKIAPVDAAGKSDGSIPWAAVKLRSVSPTSGAPSSKQIANPSLGPRPVDTASNVSSSSSIPSSWAKVKLRKVAAKENENEQKKSEESTEATETPDSEDIHHYVVRKPKSPPAKKAQPKKSGSPTATKATEGAAHPKASSLPEQKDAGIEESKSEEWDLKEITSNVSTDSSSDGTTVVPLAPSPESKTFFGLKVVVGKKGIMKIDFPPNLSQATIIWRLEVDELKSAMLDMSAYKVKLFQANGEHKDLLFESSENCMKFANAFHEVANGNDDDESVTESDGSVFVEQLSEEEQSVLEEFRKKKRLSKDPTETENVFPTPKPEPAAGLSLHDQIKARSLQPSNTMIDEPTTTVSKALASGSSLSVDEQKIVDSYKKMLQLKIPADAVRHKMEKESVDVKLMSIVLGEGDSSPAMSNDPATATNGLTVEEQAVASTYQRMLKMAVPAAGIRHKMEKDGVDVKIILAVLGDADIAIPKANGATTSELSVAEEATAAPYRKMLKLMMPEEAVEHKMNKDEVAPKIMASVLGVSSDSFGGDKKATKLTDTEESIASSFRKMLALKISKASIRQKMQTEGISKRIMVSVLGEACMKGSSNGQKTPPRRIKGGFHWSPLTSQQNLRKSVWNKSTLTEYAESDGASDISKHLELFQKKEDEADSSKIVVKKDGTETQAMAKLIDLNRANNVAITLKAFNDVSQSELAKIIEFVDPYGKIKGDRALFMRDLLPAPAEIKVIQNYKGENDRLVPAEIWFKHIAHVKRIEEKIEVMRTMETFKLEILALSESFQMLIKVCNQVMNSDKLPDLLEMVRQIGNRMNEGRIEEAAGFKLEFLSRLSQTKGSDKKTTALDLVVMLFLARNQRAALRLTGDFPECHEASKLQISELNADVRRLGGALQKCKKEKELLKQNGYAPKSAEDDGYSIRNSVEKIEEFLAQATEGYEQIKAVNEQATKTSKELSNFFCEEGGEKVTSKLLGILAVFASSLDLAVKKQDEQEKRREARLKPSQLRKSQTSRVAKGILPARSPTNSAISTITEASDDSSTRGKSLVFMVNQMLKIAGDKMKQDYAKGVTYDEPDADLKQIYDRENAKDSGVSRSDIIGKIASRRETNEEVAQTGLSELVKSIEKRSRKSNLEKFEGKPPVSAALKKSSSETRSIETALSSESRDEESSDRRRRSSVADRWTRKIEEDQVSDTGGSATLSSFSATSSEAKFQDRRRQKVINRWASNDNIVEVASKDLEEGSDVGFSNSIVSKTRQRYLNRWATRPKEEEEVSHL
jgi:hypothetical protein